MSELQKWNLTLSNQLVSVRGRILAPEQIKSHSAKFDGGLDGDWTKHVRALPMFTNAVVRTWVILAQNDIRTQVENFTRVLLKAAHGMSFMLPQPNV